MAFVPTYYPPYYAPACPSPCPSPCSAPCPPMCPPSKKIIPIFCLNSITQTEIDISGSQYYTIPFENIAVETIQTYNPSLSTYTIPCDGLYNMQTNVSLFMPTSQSQTNTNFIVSILRNDTPIASSVTNVISTTSTLKAPVSLSVIDAFKTNDRVRIGIKIESFTSTTQVNISGEIHTFSGFQL